MHQSYVDTEAVAFETKITWPNKSLAVNFCVLYIPGCFVEKLLDSEYPETLRFVPR
jgi:hypothetical protein